MKDRLERNGHKKAYYQLRLVLVIVLVLFGLLAIFAIPVGVSYGVATARAAEESSAPASSLEASAGASYALKNAYTIDKIQ